MFNEIQNYLRNTSWQKIACDVLVAIAVTFIAITVVDMLVVFNSSYDVSR